MEQSCLYIPNMLMIGSSMRNIGKTTLASLFVDKWKDDFPIIALKVTTIHTKDGKCHHGDDGCGACTKIDGDYVISEENKISNKDTGILLSKGANKVYWIRAFKDSLFTAMDEFMNIIPKNAIIICESNSLRKYVKPGIFIMMHKKNNENIKKTAWDVMDKADILVDLSLFNDTYKITDMVKVNNDDLSLSLTDDIFKFFSLVILAGGKSSRMGIDKADLTYNSESFLEILIKKGMASSFSDIIVSGYPKDICSITPVVDEIKERGPLGGLYSSFKIAKSPYSLVLSVDVPKINIDALIPMAKDHIKSNKRATLLCKNGKVEPLIGIYDTNLYKDIYEIIKDKSAFVLKLFEDTGYNAFDFHGDEEILTNINTPEDYKNLLGDIYDRN